MENNKFKTSYKIWVKNKLICNLLILIKDNLLAQLKYTRDKVIVVVMQFCVHFVIKTQENLKKNDKKQNIDFNFGDKLLSKKTLIQINLFLIKRI